LSPKNRRRGTPRSGTHAAPAALHPHPIRWTRWVAYSAIALFGLYWGIQAFTLHSVGNYAVETDFYWKYAPAADDLRHGRIDIGNYDSKGWGYPAALAGLSTLTGDTFRAGQLIALLAACFTAWLLYRTQRSLFGPSIALLTLLILLANPTFVTNTYEVGTDMFYFAVCAASIALLLRSRTPGLLAVAVSGALGGWAFSTRYNGLFLWPAAVAQILFLREPAGERGERWLRAGLWTGGFVVAALPWLVVNALHTGSPLSNNNYMNVGYLVYGQGNWEQFFYGQDRKIHSFLDIVRLDPGRFAGAVARNAVETLRRDLSDLLPVLWGVVAVAGAALVARERPGRRAGAYFLFGALYLVTIVPVFYGARFSLPMLAFYAVLVAWPFATERVPEWLRSLERTFPLRSFVFLLLWIPLTASAYGTVLDPTRPEGIRAGAHDVDEVVSWLRSHAVGEGLVARKPHAAYRAGMRFVPLTEVRSAEELHALAERGKARYLLVSGWEMRWPAIVPFASTDARIPGFRLVHETPSSLIYEILPLATGSGSESAGPGVVP
jgi:hypothetical protein